MLLLIIVIILLFGAGGWGYREYAAGSGYAPQGVIGLILVILLIYLLLGHVV